MLNVKRTGEFQRNLKMLTLGDEEFISFIEDTIVLFQRNPTDSRLHNNALHKRMRGKYSFSITDDIRVIYEKTGKIL